MDMIEGLCDETIEDIDWVTDLSELTLIMESGSEYVIDIVPGPSLRIRKTF
jgi:hypothetical protein